MDSDFSKEEIINAYNSGDLDRLRFIKTSLESSFAVVLENPKPSKALLGLKRDGLAEALLPEEFTSKSKAIALRSTDNGNCLYNSCSLALVGNESLCHLIRMLTSLELLLNSDFYATCPIMSSPEPFACIANKFIVSLSDGAAEFFLPEEKNYTLCIQKEGLLNLENKRWASLMCLLAMSGAIGMKVKSIYPLFDQGNPDRYEQMFNLVAMPPLYRNDKKIINILWSRSGTLDNTAKAGFQPNHFVPVIAGDIYGPPKLKQTELSFTSQPNKPENPSERVVEEVKSEILPPSMASVKTETCKASYSLSFDSTQQKDKTGSSRGNPVMDPCLVDDNDIGLIARDLSNTSSISDQEKLSKLGNVWKPGKNFSFPTTVESGKRKRRFNPRWLETHPWLAYSRYFDGSFCKYCVIFGNKEMLKKSRLDLLVSSPLVLWTSATGKLQAHQTSKFHQDAVDDAEAIKKEEKNEKKPILHTLSVKSQERIAQNREIMKSIIRTVVFLGQQNIAFRGHRDDSKYYRNRPGHFQAALKMVADNGNEVLKKHLETCPKNATYRSKRIQNEIIEICGSEISEILVEKVKKSQFFSVLADEVQDESNKEQLAVNIRFIEENQKISEVFLKFMLCFEGVTGRAVANLVLNAVKEVGLDMDNCRGQGYDGAGNMSGKCRGAAKLIQSDYNKALYVHCFSHQLNLCVAGSCKVPSVEKAMTNVRIISDFFNFSPKRQQLLEKILLETYGKKTKLINVCRTRWVQRLDGLDRLEEILKPVSDALSVIAKNEDRVWSADSHTNASNYLKVVTSFEFIANLVIIQRVLSYTRSITVKLQKVENDIMKGYSDIEMVKNELQDVRKQIEKHHHDWYARVKDIAQSVGTKEKMPRVCKTQTLRENYNCQSAEDYYRVTVSLPVLEHLIQEMNDRFSIQNTKATQGFCVIPAIMAKMISDNTSWRDQFGIFLSQYKDDMPLASYLPAELDLWERCWIKSKVEELPQEVMSTLKLTDADMFPNITTALKILAVLPVTTCSCERTISALGRIKTDIRSTMTQARLNGLAMMHIHQDIQLDVDRLVNRFALMHPRRMLLKDILSDEVAE